MYEKTKYPFAALAISILSGCAAPSAYIKQAPAGVATQKPSYNAVLRGGYVAGRCPKRTVRVCVHRANRKKCSCSSGSRVRDLLESWDY